MAFKALDSAELLELVLEHVDEVVYAVRNTGNETAGDVQFVSSRVRQILGREPDDFVRDPSLWISLVHADDRAALFASTAMIYQTGQPGVRSYRVRHRDGRYRWMEDRVVPTLSVDGAVVGIVGVARDVTDRREEQSALAESEARFREVVEDSPDGIVLVDRAGTIVLVNFEAERLFGYQRGELIGAAIESLIPASARSAHVGHRRRYAETPRFRPMGAAQSLLGLRKDGTTFPAEIGLSPLKGPENLVKCLIRDLTERVESERILRESEERYRTLFEDGLTGNYIASGDGRIIGCNRAFANLFGYTSTSDAIDSSLQLLFPTPAAYVAFVAAVQSRRQLRNGEVAMRRRDGVTVHMVQSVVGTTDAGGHLLEIRGQLFDDTPRKQAEAQLRQSQKMEAVGLLAGGIAHDFNNLLTVILGHAELLRTDLAATDTPIREVEEIIKGGQRASALTRQLLAFSRKQILQPTVFDLGEVASGISAMLLRLIGEQIQLRVVHSAASRVRADRNQIEQVLANLVVNARDAMPQGGTVTIETSRAPVDALIARQLGTPTAATYATLCVRDSGVGMDAATRLRVFEPFFTTKGLGKGTGLGLSTVYGIIKQSDGFIGVDSAPGRGSAFTVYLPETSEAIAEPATLEPDGCSRPVQGEVVLVVEDDPGVQALAAQLLARAGYEVLALSSGREALELVARRSGPLHVLLTDLVMPDMTGRQVAEGVLRIYPDAKVVFMSGYSAEAVVDAAWLDRAAGFLPKPFNATDLLSVLRKALG